MPHFNTRFVQMIEHNQHEGESWCFWIQLDGNEEAIENLIKLIEEEGLEDEYEFTGVTAYEFDVDVVVNLGNFGYGYMSQHHKIAGILEFPEGFEVDNIYKGNLDEFIKE